MRARRLILVAALLAAAGPAAAAEWGTIVPGRSTMPEVRAQHGEPSSVGRTKEEGHDVEEWLYEGERAPTGMERMVVVFGLAQPSGYRPDLVRTFLIQPKPGVFDRRTIVVGWGLPDRTGRDEEGEVFYYQDGLVVFFDRLGAHPRSMVFTPAQPSSPAPAPPPR
jgi:hypothetical protein